MATPEIESLLRRMDPEALIGTASYTDPETGGHFWYPKTSSAERVAEGWKVRKTGGVHHLQRLWPTGT